MSPATTAIIGIVLLILLFLLQIPVGYVMALVGFLGFSYVVSVEAAFQILVKEFWAIFSLDLMSVVIMFVFMGTLAFYSGMGGRLYDAAYKWFGKLRGGLAMATVAACAGFGAVCGSTIAGAASMGKVTLPEMRRYNYDLALATGCIASAGSLAVLIPPSTILIMYAILTEQSIIKLFAAGILPGLVLATLFVITIFSICRINPALAPAGARATWKEKIVSLSGTIDILLLFGLVMGGLFVGWFTPTEAGAIGAAGALVVALARRSLSWRDLSAALADTTRITAMAVLIVVGAMVFGDFMAVTRVPFELSEWIGGQEMSPNVIMGFIIFGYLIGGCFMDSFALIVLTVPILYPVILHLGFDPLWFGVIIVLVTEMGVITPPVGINVYVIKGVAPDVPLETIFKGIFPFLGAMIVCSVILIAFPQIVLFLPSVLR